LLDKADEPKQTEALDKSASYDNIISENTLSLLRRVFSPINNNKFDDLFEEMPDDPQETRIQANRPMIKQKKQKLDVKDLTKKLEHGATALSELTQTGVAIIDSNRSFNTDSSGSAQPYETDTLGVTESCKPADSGSFCDLVTIQ